MMLKGQETDDSIQVSSSPSKQLDSSYEGQITQETDHKDSTTDPIGSQRVYKKTSSNQLLTLYLGSRDVVARRGVVEPVKGVICIDPKIINDCKIYGQITLTFRYGREDEEVMGLKFCNEAVISLKQLWPNTLLQKEELTPLQEALIERLGSIAKAFTIEIQSLAPQSVQLLPAKRYTGAPIGTSYDIRIFTAEPIEDRIQKRSTVKLGIRLTHKICPDASVPKDITYTTNPTPRSLRLRLSPKSLKLSKQSYSLDSHSTYNSSSTKPMIEIERRTKDFNKGPQASVEKPFLWAEGRVNLKATLNKSAYAYGEDVVVAIDIRNDSRKIVRKIRVFAVQHVDVCMFSNGKFKNIVAEVDVQKQVGQNETWHGSFPLLPVRGATKNWIAVEGALFNSSTSHDTNLVALNSKLASSAPRGPQTTTDEKNVFAIYVSYYVKVKLTLSSMGGEVSLKLPFILGNVEFDAEPSGSCSGSARRARIASSPSTSQSRDEYTTIRDIETKLTISESTVNNNNNNNLNEQQAESIDTDTDIIQVHYSDGKSKLEKLKEMKLNKVMNESVDVDSDGSQIEINKIPAEATNIVMAQVHHHHYDTKQGDTTEGKT